MNKKMLKQIFSAFMATTLSMSGLALPVNNVKADDSGIESQAVEEDLLRLPIEFIDYRGDNLLFEYIMNYQNNLKYTDDLALTYSGVVDANANLVYDGYGTAYSKNLVESTLGENGLPVYTKEAVAYVAKLVQKDLNMGRNDSYTTDFYEAIKANLYKDDGLGLKRYYFGTGASALVNWNVVTTGTVEEETSTAETETSEIETTETETAEPVITSWAADGTNMKSTGIAGYIYYDFVVEENSDWTLNLYYNGAGYDYEVVAVTDGVEGTVIRSGSTTATDGTNWPNLRLDFNVGATTTLRVKFTAEDNEIISMGGTGTLYRYGDHYTLGSYEESVAKTIDSLDDITTCFDYAYYMLNHYFDKETIFGNYYDDLYSELELIRDESGLGYNFLANFDTAHGVTDGTNYLPISYDTENKIIKNDSSITETQRGFFPLSRDNAGNGVNLEAEDEESTEDEIQMTAFTTTGDEGLWYQLENSNYTYYVGQWNNSTAQGWVDPNDADHIKVQQLSSNWWGVYAFQVNRQITGLTEGETYEISVDILSTATDGILINFYNSAEVNPVANKLTTYTNTITAGAGGVYGINISLGWLGASTILDISHIVVKDASGNIVFESPSYQPDEEIIPNAIGIHEAEAAVAYSEGYEVTSNGAYSGGAAVGGLNFWPSDGYKYLTLNVNADTAGKYALKVVYAGGEAEHPCNIEVRVNGGEWIATKASDVTDWGDPSGEIVVQIDLVEGVNTIDITGASNVWYDGMGWEWVNLDYFEISRTLDTYANDTTKILGFAETAAFGGSVIENYHYAMKSSGKFVYNESENLYFNFTGDDDVYLFVNGKLALDIGGAHYAVNEVVYLNDIKDELGLVEGEIYTFDFFYLERHTDYSNLRINTNIKVMNSGATVTKAAYHDNYTGTANDREIPSATFSNVVAGEVIEYALAISNVSDIPIANLCFSDELINVYLEPVQGNYTISGMNATDYFATGNELVAKIVWDDMENGANVRKEAIATIDSLDKLSAVLKNDETGLNSLFGADSNISDSLVELNRQIIGYKENTQITLGGFKYTIPENDTIVVNDVEAFFYAYQDINFADDVEKQSAGVDDHITIIAKEYFAQDNADVTVELTDMINSVEEINDTVLLQIQANAASNITAEGGNTTYGSVAVSNGTANYTPNGTSYNPVDDDFVYYTTVEETVDGVNTSTVVAIPVTVHLYDVNDDIYVLDYGIPVDLNAEPAGIFTNDEIDDAGWSVKKLVVGDNGTTDDNYGTIDTSNFSDSFMHMSEVEGKNLKYKLDTFFDSIDERIYTVKIRKNDGSANFDNTVTAGQGVDLESNVKIMPGNVVYYEDNFVDIKKSDGTTVEGGASNTDKTQSNENEGPYGNDSAYDNEDGDSDGRAAIISTTAYYDADGKYHSGTSDEVTFTFTGTGFDIIGRTNQTSPYVMVQYTDNGKNLTKLVNTCYTNGELYQVPVVSVRDLTNGSHTVKILVAPTKTSGTEAGSAKFYLDGIRIYNPSSSSEVINNYVVEEKNAVFANVHDMLIGTGEVVETIGEVNGQEVIVDTIAEGRNALLVSVPSNGNGIGKPLLLGYSNTEEITSSTTGLYTNSLTDYLAKGPNNEVYLSSGNAIAFTIDDYIEGQSTVQIEAKRVKMSNSGDGDNVKLVSIYQENDVYKEYEIATVNTDTAMYYDIPIDKCIKTSFGYLVVIEGITTSEYCLSISNVKTSGCLMSCPTYGTYGQIGIDPDKVVLPAFEFIDVSVKNTYASKDATVEIRVFADANEDWVYDEDFDGKFDAYFDTASPGEEDTSITYGFAGEDDTEAYWARVGSVKNNDSTVTYIYRLRMPKDAQNMTLILSHSDDDYTYKVEKLVNVINPFE